MEAGNILSADVLDIIFDTRNKAYGAYDLRKNYQRRLVKALLTMFFLVLLLLVAYFLGAAIRPHKAKRIEVRDFELEHIVDKKIEPPPVVIPPKPQVVEVKTKMFAKFLITPDDKVPEDERPPEQTELTDAKIGTANIDGKADDGIQGPPVDEATHVVDAPKKHDADDNGFVPVEVESLYPGGVSAWSAFLNRNLVYPQDAADNNIQGTVFVQFIVDAEGNVSNISALSGPEELRPAAVAVIKKSGKWTPALQNGRHVKSYKKQPITFKLLGEG